MERLYNDLHQMWSSIGIDDNIVFNTEPMMVDNEMDQELSTPAPMMVDNEMDQELSTPAPATPETWLEELPADAATSISSSSTLQGKFFHVAFGCKESRWWS